jgi:Mrp family chromosome partitioning ATPase
MNPILTIIPSMIFSVIFGVAVALLLGKLDKRIYLPSDLAEGFSFPYAGGVPARRRCDSSSADPASGTAGYNRAIDALVAKTLLLQRAAKRALLITTADDERGASGIALNFACAVARMGRRVVLIDMHISGGSRRIGRKHESNPKLDVFDVLSRRCAPTAAIQRLTGTGLDYLPSRNEDGTDTLPLIANGQLKQLITELRASYDWVILIGPPVIGCGDTPLVAAAVDAAMLIVRSGRSTFPDVKDALDTLALSMSLSAFADASSDVFTVLTDVPRRRLPTPFRDNRAVRRKTNLLQPAARSVSTDVQEGANDPSIEDDGDPRLVRSRG